MFILLAGGLLVIVIAVIVAVVSSVVSAVAANEDIEDLKTKLPKLNMKFW